ncbi:MAG: molybdopterin molybdotransferase MoeA [Actinobacteria bacterium]|nr:molybdopterin molybdotransferase MoeA [Actinomycetota bacterium]MBI3688498.1 molybdopterin molybdotransferase MoeA [Actinomycetota bacterium]
MTSATPIRTVEEHVQLVLGRIAPPEPIELALLDAQGLLCAEEVLVTEPMPSFANSSMDGYAVRALDVADAAEDNPVVLPVVGDVAAGSRTAQSVAHGVCVRIMTGGPMPSGADAVVPVEWTDGGVARVSITRSATKGNYIRRIGEDARTGDVAVTVGTPIGPAQVGLLAAVGRERVLVRPRPRVVVISTGSELVEVGQPPAYGQITDSNSYMLAAAARDAGAEVYRAGIVPDDKRRLLDMLQAQLGRADILITSGGVSMGAFDVVKEALREFGTMEFVRVAMQPGMPQGFGTLGDRDTPVYCLPGNPVSSLVSFEVFVRPAIRMMLGKRRLFRRTVAAVLSQGIESPAGRRQYRRGLLHRDEDGYSVAPVGGPGSHLLANLAQANCLIVVDEAVTEVPAGEPVTVLPLLLSGG